MMEPFIHPSAVIDHPCTIGEGTKVWHFTHIMEGAVIGKNCMLAQNVFVAGGARIGNGVKVQNNVSVFSGVTLEDNVFVGPSVVFTNDLFPRSAHPKPPANYIPTLVKTGASIGANATVLCGITIGAHAFIGSGAVVTEDVPAYALVYGTPAQQNGFVCECGARLTSTLFKRRVLCASCGSRYRKQGAGLEKIS